MAAPAEKAAGARPIPALHDPRTDREYHRKPLAELTEEEKYEPELRRTQLIEAAPAAKFTNMMMKGGNREPRLEKYHAASAGEQATIERNPPAIFQQAPQNCAPVIGLVPWMIKECREKKHRRMLMPEKLSHEPLEAFHTQGPVIKKKRDMHKMAQASRALARYRWR
ncbi:unnamed protein product [Nyctereutes procyonoides]|uniref:(raccoon dog) hypothetical protein n=1 Tax=Nyctereutes procyonoides TaxID=34880 RepID=A0A811ZH10_NYCPR|nr:unnamed protein product [Nyctereutes procyonoides]